LLVGEIQRLTENLALFQRNSISPAEREKYRPRSPPEVEHKKVKKEEKDCHVRKF